MRSSLSRTAPTKDCAGRLSASNTTSTAEFSTTPDNDTLMTFPESFPKASPSAGKLSLQTRRRGSKSSRQTQAECDRQFDSNSEHCRYLTEAERQSPPYLSPSNLSRVARRLFAPPSSLGVGPASRAAG
ncbi:hypothetical protein CONLIGDRAFT_388642 [Coniochaeta ligniaria NRRL 30616]|uniref:Uncharacterized protein n=1 Tax=Coniochaeta ligniaria NRRL 30616 TaxID=1408157 RepID=A0A1J7IM19_9PEZI|nr:hypothetical protein CONLIGDRAFT_388642 [Coniochaeta ligniaria NRRL 30616]